MRIFIILVGWSAILVLISVIWNFKYIGFGFGHWKRCWMSIIVATELALLFGIFLKKVVSVDNWESRWIKSKKNSPHNHIPSKIVRQKEIDMRPTLIEKHQPIWRRKRGITSRDRKFLFRQWKRCHLEQWGTMSQSEWKLRENTAKMRTKNRMWSRGIPFT